jgi:hypothetical protein
MGDDGLRVQPHRFQPGARQLQRTDRIRGGLEQAAKRTRTRAAQAKKAKGSSKVLTVHGVRASLRVSADILSAGL